MAQPIHCDYGGCDALAEVMLSVIVNGDTTAWCASHFLEYCVATLNAVAEQEAAETAALAQARLAGVQPPPAADELVRLADDDDQAAGDDDQAAADELGDDQAADDQDAGSFPLDGPSDPARPERAPDRVVRRKARQAAAG